MDEVIKVLKNSCIHISELIRNNNSLEMGQFTNNNNVSGDNTKILDIETHHILTNDLRKCKYVKRLISEESEKIIDTENEEGKYLVCYDPLDGSSNIDINVGTGTIFSIFDNDKIKAGRDIIAAGYCIYSSSTQLVLAYNKEVNMYQLIDREFKLIKKNIKIPNKGNIYSINESYRLEWKHTYDKQMIMKCLINKYNFRCVGSLVLDAHRILMNGGFFSYPINKSNKQGKIRLIYEAYPIAYIIYLAGGYATSLYDDILKLGFPIDDIHKKTELRLFSYHEYIDFINIRDFRHP